MTIEHSSRTRRDVAANFIRLLTAFALAVPLLLAPRDAARAQAECNVVPPRCQSVQNRYAQYAQGLASRLNGPSTALAAALDYCSKEALDEVLRFCKAEYQRAGKPTCASIIDQQIAADRGPKQSSMQAYAQSSDGSKLIIEQCGF